MWLTNTYFKGNNRKKKKQLLRENGVFSSKFDQSSNIQIYKEESIRKLGLCLTSSEHLDNQELQ